MDILQGIYMSWSSLFFRGKNFEKGSDYNKTWKATDDGQVNTNGPRVVVGEQQGFQGGFITRYFSKLATWARCNQAPSCTYRRADITVF